MGGWVGGWGGGGWVGKLIAWHRLQLCICVEFLNIFIVHFCQVECLAPSIADL